MKRVVINRIALCTLLGSITFCGTIRAQETGAPEARSGGTAEASAVIDSNNPGMAWLDQATEAKLRARSAMDLSQVITLCLQAKEAGLSGENLKYCNQLLATCQLERGLYLAQELLGIWNARPDDWQNIRQRILEELEEGVAVITDHPAVYLRIAQLNLLPDGDVERAKEVLKLAIETAKDTPPILFQAVSLLADLEPEADKRAAVLATAAQNGNPEITILHALTLFEMKRNEEATEVLRKLTVAESGNTGLHERVVALLIDYREYTAALAILDTLRERDTDSRWQHRVDLMRAEVLAKREQFEEALAVLNTLAERTSDNRELMVLTYLLRSATYLAMDELDKALNDVEAAERIHPGLIPVLEHKFKILIEQENYEGALALVKRLQAIDQRPQYFLREILVLNELDKYDEAVAAAEKLREQYPEEEPQWIMVLVEIHTRHKAYEKALALVEEQLKEEPEELRWIIAKTQVFTGQEKWDEAVLWLESHLQENPESREFNLLLISVFADQKSYRAAKERMQTLLAKDPDDIGLLRFDSQLSISLGLHSEAVKALTQVIEAAPEDYTSVNNLAWILCTSPIDSVRDGRRAVELAEQAAELTHYRRAFVLSTLAAAYAETGDFEKAREISLKSVEIAKAERNMTEEARKEMLEHLQKEWDAFSQDMPFREMLNEEREE